MRRVQLLLVSLTVGCGAGAEPGDLTAVPARQAVAINVPGASTSSASTSSQPATFYIMTRQISTQLNSAPASFFDVVETAMATPAAGRDATTAYWGPFTDALSPMTAELGVSRVNTQDYQYFLGGKPKAAPNTAFMGLFGGAAHLAGTGRGSGELDVNFTEMNTLDPTVHPATGGMAFKYDNSGDPRTVEVHFGDFFDGTPGATPLTATYQYAEHADTSGNFAFALRTNFDNDPNGILEDAALTTRWLASGAGRGDLVATGGSLPAGFTVHATECWDTSFARVFYTEDVDPKKTEGSVSACALP